LGLAGEEKAGRGCLTPNATPPGRREERAGGGGRGHAGGQALKLAARGKAMQPASAAGRVVVAVGFTFTPRLGLGWVGWSLAQEKEHTGGAASSVVSLAALPCPPACLRGPSDTREPPWLAAFRSREVRRNHRARAFSCTHVFWIGAAVSTCMIKPCGFKFLFFSEDGFKVQFNWPAATLDRSTVESGHDLRWTDGTCAVDHGRWCAQRRLH